jgi:hypothetical protein
MQEHYLCSVNISSTFTNGDLEGKIYKHFEQFEGSKDPTLSLEQQDYLEASVVVDEGDPVAVALWSRHGHRARHIGVNEIERSSSAMAGRREGSGMHFASEAWLADRIALCG